MLKDIKKGDTVKFRCGGSGTIVGCLHPYELLFLEHPELTFEYAENGSYGDRHPLFDITPTKKEDRL